MRQGGSKGMGHLMLLLGVEDVQIHQQLLVAVELAIHVLNLGQQPKQALRPLTLPSTHRQLFLAVLFDNHHRLSSH